MKQELVIMPLISKHELCRMGRPFQMVGPANAKQTSDGPSGASKRDQGIFTVGAHYASCARRIVVM